jgi:tetratricopeptide (TPR) repeat protein
MELQTTLGIACLVADDVARAIRVLEGVIAVQPSASLARYHLAKALILHERLDEAGAHLEQLVAEEPRASFVSADGHVRALRGDVLGAERSLAALSAPLAGGRTRPHYLRAVVHAGMGDDRRATSELRLALAANEPWTGLAHIDSLLAPVHTSRRFATVMDASRIARAV